MTNNIISQSKICQECGNQYEINNRWPFILCQECANQKNKDWVKIWISEILGYNEAIGDFMPVTAIESFKAARKEAIRKYYI